MAIMSSTSYPFIMTLLHENSDSAMLAYDYTEAEGMFWWLTTNGMPVDFPSKLIDELKTVPNVIVRNGVPIYKSLASVLDRFVTLNIDQLESGNFLNSLLLAIGKALGMITSNEIVEDTTPDMAAACTLIFLAALKAKDNAKCSVSRGWTSWDQMQMRYYDAMYISVVK